MEFIKHALNWCNGEIFEGKMVALFGIVVVVISILFWKFGATPFAKAMFIPLLVVGLFYTAVGGTLIINNKKRIAEYQVAYKENPTEFVKSEKDRTESFIKWYPYTMYIMSGIIIIGLGSYMFWGGAWGRAIGLSSILLGFSTLFLDHFSEERAEVYHQSIVKELKAK